MEFSELNFEEIAAEMVVYFQKSKTAQKIEVKGNEYLPGISIGFEYGGKGIEIPLIPKTLFEIFVLQKYIYKADNNS